MKTREQNPKGLHQRFLIRKITGWKEKPGSFGGEHIPTSKAIDKEAEYFVMRLDEKGKDPNHIKACRIGVHAYADAIESTIPQLAKDLKERYPLL